MKNVYVYMKKVQAGEVDTSETIGTGIVIDRDRHGEIIGIEVLGAHHASVTEAEEKVAV